MKQQKYILVITMFLFFSILTGCNMPQEEIPVESEAPTDPLQEEPAELESPSVPSEDGSTGAGSETVDDTKTPNALPAAMDFEEASVDLEKLGLQTVGGGGGNNCVEALSVKTEQEITLRFDGLSDEWQLCFYNFPIGSAQLKLSTQSGAFDTVLFLDPELEGVEAYGQYVNLPASVVRDGPLEVEFSVGSVVATETFDIQSLERVTIFQDTSDVQILIDPYIPRYQFQTGDRVEILGVNLQPLRRVFVGIYGVNDFDTNLFSYLVEQFEVTTNQDGEFLGAFMLDEKYRQGSYKIYFGYEPDLLENRDWENSLDGFSVLNTSQAWQPCLADYDSGLRVGDVGFVSDDPFLPNNIRNVPSLAGDVIGQIQPEEYFIVLDGPICESGWIWWYVQGAYDYEANDVLKGWTSEGDAESYWLYKYVED